MSWNPTAVSCQCCLSSSEWLIASAATLISRIGKSVSTAPRSETRGRPAVVQAWGIGAALGKVRGSDIFLLKPYSTIPQCSTVLTVLVIVVNWILFFFFLTKKNHTHKTQQPFLLPSLEKQTKQKNTTNTPPPLQTKKKTNTLFLRLSSTGLQAGIILAQML